MRKWYRPIGFHSGSDHFNWSEKHPCVEYGKEQMGPDFIGYLEITTIDNKRPMQYGHNVVGRGFIFFGERDNLS
jgi:hypothetical protein